MKIVIQATLGWQYAHLHAFIDGQTYYGVPILNCGAATNAPRD